MNFIPDRLWQELAGDAIWTSIGFGVAQAWKHRKATQRKPVLLSGVAGGKSTVGGTLRVVKDVDLRWSVRQTVGKDVDLRWNIEAPTPSFARRLEELASWYLHVS